MVGSADAGSGSGTLDTAKSTSVAGSVVFKGEYNANTNSPNLDSSPSCVKQGDQYVVSVGGTAFFSESLQAGDSLIAKQDDPTTADHWIKIQSNLVTPIVASTCLSATGTKDSTTFLRGDDTWAVAAPIASPTFTGTVTTAAVDVAGNNIDNIQNLIHDISTTTTALDFSGDQVQTISISAATTFTTSNLAVGKSKTIKITTDGTLRTLTFPAWKFVGTKPTDQAASKVGILTLTSFGTTDADCVAAYTVEE